MPANANLNQSVQGEWNGNNVNVGAKDTSVEFRNHASVDCKITFGNPDTFGADSVSVYAGRTTTLGIQQRVGTTYNLPSAGVSGGPQYEITVRTAEESYQRGA
jgi:hypothetical protein